MKTIRSICILFLLLFVAVSAQAAEPFANTVIGTTGDFLSGLSWNAGIVRSFANPDKSGIVVKASRLIYSVDQKFDINADLFAVEGEGGNHDAIGLGFSSKVFGADIGVGYLSAGYGWSLTLTPLRF